MHTHYHKTLCRLSKSQTWPRRGRKDMPKAGDLGQTDVRTDRTIFQKKKDEKFMFLFSFSDDYE